MSQPLMIFRIGAFIALLFLIRHSHKLNGTRRTAILFATILLMSVYREGSISFMARFFGYERPYQPRADLGHIGFLNFVVLAGWIFCTYLSFNLGRMIQRRHFPATNIFFTLALTALVSMTVSYPVEVTGMHLGMWLWSNWALQDPIRWIPFQWPFDAFQGWSNTTFMLMLVYCGIDQRLFSNSALTNALITLGLFFVWVYSFAFLPTLARSYDAPTWLFFVYLAAATMIGITGPVLPWRRTRLVAGELPNEA